MSVEPKMSDAELRAIPGYQGLYGVTQDGRVWSYARGEWKKPWVTRQGYLRVNLYCHRVTDSQQAHRLVALAWLPNPDGLPMINHKDGDKQHNHVSNLEWCTSSHNNRHAIRTGLNPRTDMRRVNGRFA